MGISMISNPIPSTNTSPSVLVSIPNGDKHDFKLVAGSEVMGEWKFQSPMGISMISNVVGHPRPNTHLVSIPNGDKHDFKPTFAHVLRSLAPVSIPNGDKHDFKPRVCGSYVMALVSFNPQWG